MLLLLFQGGGGVVVPTAPLQIGVGLESAVSIASLARDRVVAVDCSLEGVAT